MFQVDNPLSTK